MSDSKTKDVTETKTEKSLPDRVKRLEAQVNYALRQLEKLFGKDFTMDGKIGAILLGFLLCSGIAQAADELIKWTGTNGATVTIYKSGDMKVSGAVYAMTTNLATSSDFTVAGNLTVDTNVVAGGRVQGLDVVSTGSATNLGTTKLVGKVTADALVQALDVVSTGSATNLGTRPEWSICAWLRMRQSISFGL
jgi:hypothetical protein